MKPIAFFFTQYTDYCQLIKDQSETTITPPSLFQGGKQQTTMGEDKYPFYPIYVPPKRDMKAIKKDFNTYLDKLSSKKLLK